MSERRAQQKTETRQRLLQAARAGFIQDGFLFARTVDIAERAGVSHGALFAHFPSREALVRAVVEDFGLELGGRLHEQAETSDSLEALLKLHLEGLTTHEALYQRLLIDGPLLQPELRLQLLGLQSALAHQLERAVTLGQAAGTIKPMPFHLLFNTWLGLLHHYLQNASAFAPGKSVLTLHGPSLLGHFLSLISPSATPALTQGARDD